MKIEHADIGRNEIFIMVVGRQSGEAGDIKGQMNITIYVPPQEKIVVLSKAQVSRKSTNSAVLCVVVLISEKWCGPCMFGWSMEMREQTVIDMVEAKDAGTRPAQR